VAVNVDATGQDHQPPGVQDLGSFTVYLYGLDQASIPHPQIPYLAVDAIQRVVDLPAQDG
jgi:hypothetical protein